MGTLNIPCASRRQRHRGEGKGPVFHVEHWLSFFLVRWWDCAPVRGAERFFIKANCSLLMSKENQKTTSDFDALDPRERGCSPLSDPEGEVEVEKC